MTNLENIQHLCFFCSRPIVGKKSEEHIIPNSLLGRLGIKENFLEGGGKFQYSRIKVPAHPICNNEFGSRYENKIVGILDSPNQLFDEISQDEGSVNLLDSPSNNSISLLTTWLSKIYYGLFYHDYLKLKQAPAAGQYKSIIDSRNFRRVQKSYQENYGFSLPSSLFVFQAKDNNFDLKTFVRPQAMLLKVQHLVLILCIADGYLTKAHLNKENLTLLRQHLLNLETDNPDLPSYLMAFAEVLAFRLSISKTPKFVYSNQCLTNMSFNTSVKDPESFYQIDDKVFMENKKDVLSSLNIIIT